jgi:hypothetical protein
MDIRRYENKDFETLESWFKHYDWSTCDKDMISVDSFFVSLAGVDIAYSGVYFVKDNPVAVLGFTISNPDIKPEVRDLALDDLFNYIMKYIEDKGTKILTYYTDSKSMVKRLSSKHGMEITDNGDAYILMRKFNNIDVGFLE